MEGVVVQGWCEMWCGISEERASKRKQIKSEDDQVTKNVKGAWRWQEQRMFQRKRQEKKKKRDRKVEEPKEDQGIEARGLKDMPQ